MSVRRVCDRCNRAINISDEDSVHVEIRLKGKSAKYLDYHLKCYEKLAKMSVYELHDIENKTEDK